jgi:hypothetical protein
MGLTEVKMKKRRRSLAVISINSIKYFHSTVVVAFYVQGVRPSLRLKIAPTIVCNHTRQMTMLGTRSFAILPKVMLA